MPRAEKISKRDRAVIKTVKRTNVEQTLAKLGPVISTSRWVPKSNRYAVNTINCIRIDSAASGTLRPRALSQYIASSAILHCADGWSFLGRALHCLLKGDPHRVVHLAYYAELRAALSLLASEGVGVFSKNHFVIDGVNSVRALPSRPGTHVAVWNYLKYWGSLKRSGDLFADVIAPGGMSLGSWFEGMNLELFLRPKAKSWLGQWSLDIGLFADDHTLRNHSSYRPDGIPEPWYLGGQDALQFATELWEACEPSSAAPFDEIDRYVLRLTIEGAYTATHNRSSTADPPHFAAFVAPIVNRQSFEPAVANEWKQFLTRNLVPNDPNIFSYSSQVPTEGKGASYAAILSRAALLLRLATGSSVKLIRSAGITGDQIEFWWSRLGINRGVWAGTKPRTDLLDLWDDVEALISDARQFQQNTPAADQSFHLIGDRIPQVVAGLGGCERVAIWSLASS
jgi:hypothetical protein